MSRFVRENVYRLQIGNKKHARQFLCLEFIRLVGAPAVSAWIETEVPREYNRETNKWVGGYSEQTEKTWVYGNQMLAKKKRLNTVDRATYTACEALAKDVVYGKEAGDLVQLVWVEWFRKAPKAVTKQLREAAPEWWAFVHQGQPRRPQHERRM